MTMLKDEAEPTTGRPSPPEDDFDHRALIAALSDAERRALTERRDLPGLARLAFHWGAILALGAAIAGGAPFWPLLMLPQGVLIVFLFTSIHEAVHDTAFRTGWLNRMTAAVGGFLLALPPLWFRSFHFAHHRHTHDPENDPELEGGKPESLRAYLLYMSGLPVWRSHLAVLARNALGRNADRFVPEKARARIAREARIMLAGYAALLAISVATGSAVLVWVWILPALIGQPFLRGYLLAEHTRCPHVANMLDNTRTTFTNAAVRLIAWNMPYHTEHHSYPQAPFHRLPMLHRLMRERLRHTQDGYLAFNLDHARRLAEEEAPRPAS
jgi:fatty acid desaturase